MLAAIEQTSFSLTLKKFKRNLVLAHLGIDANLSKFFKLGAA